MLCWKQTTSVMHTCKYLSTNTHTLTHTRTHTWKQTTNAFNYPCTDTHTCLWVIAHLTISSFETQSTSVSSTRFRTQPHIQFAVHIVSVDYMLLCSSDTSRTCSSRTQPRCWCARCGAVGRDWLCFPNRNNRLAAAGSWCSRRRCGKRSQDESRRFRRRESQGQAFQGMSVFTASLFLCFLFFCFVVVGMLRFHFPLTSDATSVIKNCICVCVCECVCAHVCVLMLMCVCVCVGGGINANVYWFAPFICLPVKLLYVCICLLVKLLCVCLMIIHR